MADGTIPDNQVAVLREIGDFLRTHGEAIYGTRPWLSYGEGPTRMAKGGHFVGTVRYGSRDIRYTRSKDGKTVYAIVLGWPEAPLTLTHVKAAGEGRVDLSARHRRLGPPGPGRSRLSQHPCQRHPPPHPRPG